MRSCYGNHSALRVECFFIFLSKKLCSHAFLPRHTEQLPKAPLPFKNARAVPSKVNDTVLNKLRSSEL